MNEIAVSVGLLWSHKADTEAGFSLWKNQHVQYKCKIFCRHKSWCKHSCENNLLFLCSGQFRFSTASLSVVKSWNMCRSTALTVSNTHREVFAVCRSPCNLDVLSLNLVLSCCFFLKVALYQKVKFPFIYCNFTCGGFYSKIILLPHGKKHLSPHMY